MTTPAPVNHKEMNRVLVRSLMHMHFVEGTVCSEFRSMSEPCDHPACRSSYNSWVVATQALDKYGLLPGEGVKNIFPEPEFVQMSPKTAEKVFEAAFQKMWGFLALIEMGKMPEDSLKQLRLAVAQVVYGSQDVDADAMMRDTITHIERQITEQQAAANGG